MEAAREVLQMRDEVLLRHRERRPKQIRAADAVIHQTRKAAVRTALDFADRVQQAAVIGRAERQPAYGEQPISQSAPTRRISHGVSDRRPIFFRNSSITKILMMNHG